MFRRLVLFIILGVVSHIAGHADSYRPKLHVCTVSSHPSYGLDQLLYSARCFQVPVHVMGMGLPYPGNGMKLVYVREYLNKLPENDVLMFVDAFDCLILADAVAILDKFQGMNAPFVISTETACYPFPDLAARYPWAPTPYRYINSGSFIGYVGYMRWLIDDMGEIIRNTSDQGQFTKQYFRNPEKYTLDYYQELFWALHGTPATEMEFDVAGKRVQSRLTHNYPCVVHGNGGGRKLYQRVYDTLFKGKKQSKRTRHQDCVRSNTAR